MSTKVKTTSLAAQERLLAKEIYQAAKEREKALRASPSRWTRKENELTPDQLVEYDKWEVEFEEVQALLKPELERLSVAKRLWKALSEEERAKLNREEFVEAVRLPKAGDDPSSTGIDQSLFKRLGIHVKSAAWQEYNCDTSENTPRGGHLEPSAEQKERLRLYRESLKTTKQPKATKAKEVEQETVTPPEEVTLETVAKRSGRKPIKLTGTFAGIDKVSRRNSGSYQAFRVSDVYMPNTGQVLLSYIKLKSSDPTWQQLEPGARITFMAHFQVGTAPRGDDRSSDELICLRNVKIQLE